MIERVVVSKVTKRFGPSVALRGISATFEPGLTLVEGPNGSGKTTLLGIIGGMIRPSSGSVLYPPVSDAVEIREELGWVSHDSLCYGDLSGKQNLEFAARVHGIDARTAWDEATARFALRGFAERRLRTNSRGQKQRVALAKAVLHDPTVVLLDEPTTGLDKDSVEHMLGLIDRAVRAGGIWIVVTHEPGLFGPLKPTRLRLERGRID
jgi:heme exporter protein A